MIETFASRSGHACIRVDGIALHSPYDPVKEAARFAAGLGDDPPSMVVVLGEGLGYACTAIAERFPLTRVVPVYYSEELYRASTFRAGFSWHPDSGDDLQDWFRRIIGELDVEGLRVVEWPPSGRVFPDASRRAQACAQTAVQEASGSLLTTVGFGRVWLRNSIMNFLCLEDAATGNPCPPEAPVIVAAPGPSLEASLPVMRKARGSFVLWALPSALHALEAGGVLPDLIVMTDPGHWSAAHLRFTASRCPVAMPLSAAKPNREPARPVFLLSQPTFFEERILERAGIAAPSIPPHGTVAATALDLALASTRGPVAAAGLDLCVADIITHARPNLFDRLRRLSANRLAPHYSEAFLSAIASPADSFPGTSGRIRVPRALKTYAGWLSSHEHGAAGRMFRIAPSSVDLRSMRGVPVSWIRELPPLRDSSPRLASDPRFPGRSKRASLLRGMLAEWIGAVAKGLGEVKSASGPAALARDSGLFSLLSYIEPQALLEVRRQPRRGKIPLASDAAVTLLEDARAFLELLLRKTGA
jgi:hypothetical protein